MSDIFETEFGFHIALLHEKEDAEMVPFDDVSERLQQDLMRERTDGAIEGFVQKLRHQGTQVGQIIDRMADTRP